MHAIVIPGNGRVTEDGSYALSARCVAALKLASRLAEQELPRAVIFSGWSPVGGITEAEQMFEAWDGPRDVELVLEPTARITAENMSRTLPLLVERDVRSVTLICGRLHLPRVRYFFGGVYPRFGIRCTYRVVPHGPLGESLAWEAAAIPLARRQRRAAVKELRRLLTSED
jgi:uncharacterized SAM-binding protein YcdF (DUF218 family)